MDEDDNNLILLYSAENVGLGLHSFCHSLLVEQPNEPTGPPRGHLATGAIYQADVVGTAVLKVSSTGWRDDQDF